MAERQSLAQGGFVYLDDGQAGGFEVLDFIAQGERDLFGRRAAWLVVAYEAPLQNRDRATESTGAASAAGEH